MRHQATAEIFHLPSSEGKHKRPRKPNTGKGKPKFSDEVYFLPKDVRAGKTLVNFSRFDTGAIWHIDRIITHDLTPSGNYRPEKVNVGLRNTDTVYLHCEATGEKRSVRMQTLITSSAWRLNKRGN